MNIIDSRELHPVVKDKFQFLTVPLSPKADFTNVIHYLYHNGDEFVSTDSYRLHIVKDENLPIFEQGFYKIIKKNKSSFLFILEEEKEFTFPDYKFIIPKEKSEKEFKGNTFISALTFIIRNIPENETINPDYVKNLYPQENQDWQLGIYDSKTMFKNNDMLAIIMHRNIK